MTATLINGTKIAEDIEREVAAEVATLKEGGVRLGLAVVLVGEDAASSAYVNMKAKTCEQLGIYSRKLTIPSAITTEQLLGEVKKLNEDDSIDGILVQLPLPKHVKKHAILKGVDPKKDVDGVHSANVGSQLGKRDGRGAISAAEIQHSQRRRYPKRFHDRFSRLTQLLVTPFILTHKNDPRFAAFCQKLKVPVPTAIPKA